MIGEIVNHLWQSTVFAAAAALLTLAFRKNRAQVRYWVWLSASVKFLVPFALLIGLGNRLWDSLPAARIVRNIAAPSVSQAMAQIGEPFSESFANSPSAAGHATHWIPIAILGVWGCGFLAIVMVRFRGWLRVRAAVIASRPADIASTVAVRSTPGLLEPGVVGILRPALLLPEGIEARLGPEQMAAVIKHEECHVQRRDNLTAAIHMIVEAVFWFHPVVWWIGTKLVEERERACDEAVLSLGSVPRVYVEGILNVCKTYLESPLSCMSGVTGSDLKKRVFLIMAGNDARRLNFSRKLLLAVAGFAALTMPLVFGVTHAGASRARFQPQDATPNLAEFKYEVASIKPNKSGTNSHGTQSSAEEYRAVNISAMRLIRQAYGFALGTEFNDGRVVGAPSWLDAESYDIEAKMESSVTDALAKLSPQDRDLARKHMLQTLLADRFKLIAHHETRELPVYELIVMKSGPKLREANANDTYANGYKLPNGKPAGQGFHSDEDGKVAAQGVTIAGVAQWLSRQVGRTVVDKTGLTGKYDLNLEWTKDSDDPSAEATGPTIFTAVQQQLGLKLVSTKGPVDIIVIDHVERPSGN